MDRPLSLAGRIILKENDKYIKKIIDLNKPLCVIPSEAIHQNKKANINLDLNPHIEICDYDLFLHTLDKPMYIGANNEMILCPRADDLTCTFAAFKSFIENTNDKNINVMCVFNSEEIGSLTQEGADSSFLIDTLKRICTEPNLDISISLSNSLIISANSIDVGISQLAMHSANEIVGSDDTFHLYKAFEKFYNISIKYKENNIQLIERK